MVVGCKRQYLGETADSAISTCGTYLMGFTPAGDFTLFNYGGEKLITQKFEDVSNCYFSYSNKFIVVTHGSGKATKVTVIRIHNKEVCSSH